MACKYLVQIIVGFLAFCFYYVDFTNESPLLRLSGPEFFEHYGYKGEEYLVESLDGLFINKIHRLGNGENKKVVLFVPGIHCPSEIFFGLGPKFDLSYKVYHGGYDTWFANYRGSMNTIPKENATLSEEDLTDFSFHEQGVFDVSAQIDYILRKTGEKSLQIIAGSMGANAVIALLATKPEYNDKISKVLFLGPTGPFTKLTSPIQYLVYWILTFHKGLADWIAMTRNNRAEVSHLLCTHPLMPISCASFMNMYLGYHDFGVPKEDTATALRLMFTGPWTGIYDHFAQMMSAGRYVMRDYGTDKNLQVYHTEKSPEYDITNFKVPAKLYYAEVDKFLNDEGRVEMMRLIPNLKETFGVKWPFGHGNFLSATGVDELLVGDVIGTLGRENL